LRLLSSLALILVCTPWLGPASAFAQDEEVSGAESESVSESVSESEPVSVSESEPESVSESEPVSGSVTTDAPLPTFEEGDPLARLTRPGEARNEAEPERTARGALWIPRLIFAPLRFAIWLVTQPLAEISRLNDKYDFVARFLQLFVSEDGTYGIVPNFFVETGFGLNGGLRAFHDDLFGHGESIHARVGFGGFNRQHYQLTMASGDASPLFRIGGGVRYEVRDNDRFFGIGNVDRVEPEEASLPLSPYDRDVAVKSRYRHRTLIGDLGIALKFGHGARLRLSQRWEWSRLDVGDPQPTRTWIDDAYDVDRLVAFGTQTHATTELRFILDRRRSPLYGTPDSIPSRGVFLQAWAGWVDGVREDPSKFATLGFDMDGYINLYNDDRVLKVRTRYETVIGQKERIPFDHWAQLSGPDLLRGYPRGRFQGRHAGVVSLEYRYAVSSNMSAFLFTDLGIIANTWEQARPDRWRVGYGGGVFFHSPGHALVALQIAASEEGVYVNFSFAPTSARTSIPRRMSP
jgi:hypothetical protein